MYIPIGYNPAPVNEPPVASISFDNEYLYIGQLVALRGNNSYDPEGNGLFFDWRFVTVPSGSAVAAFTPALTDYSTVTFVPDVIGIYVVELVVFDGVLSSDPVSITMVARQLPVPHGQTYEPDMRWLFNFVRDWVYMVEDREKIAVLWSAYAQILSEVLLRAYEVNLSKSIATIPELLQWRWRGFRLKVVLPDSYLLYAGSNYSGVSGQASSIGDASAVIVEKPINVDKGRVLVFDGQARAVNANSTRFPYQDFTGTTIQGTRIGLSRTVDSGARHVRWWLCTGTVRYDVDTLYQLRCYAGDLLEVDLMLQSNAAPVLFRIYGVTRTGYIGFEFSPAPLSDSYTYMTGGKYKAEVTQQLEDAFFRLGLDPGQYTYNQLASRFLDLCRTRNFTKIQNDFGITLRPRNIYRLSRFQVDSRTISVPYLQSAIRNPVFVLRENVDFVVQEDEDGRYIQLASSVTLDETDLPRSLWSEVVYLDNGDAIEDNFGILVGGERDKLPDRVTDYEHYRGAVAGLMYAFVTGPTPDNIRLGVQIVLGLPFTAERGYVRLIDSRYSTTEGMIVIEDANQDDEPTGFQRIYKYPLTASLETNPTTGQQIKTGDLLERFFPLCTGVQIRDWVNTPDWWTPLYDGRTALPEPHEAFFDYGWNPAEANLWPEEALKTFEEIQKVHIFEVRLDAATFAVEDVQFAAKFVRGVNQTWRLGLEKKGIRPHYTYPLFVVTLELEDQIDVRDRVTLTGEFQLVDDFTGYETSLSDGHRNASGALLMHVDAPFQASRFPYRKMGRFVRPVVDGQEEDGAVRLDLDVYQGTISVGNTLTGAGGDQAEVIAIVAADPAEAPVTHIALVRYNNQDLFQEYDHLDNGSGAEATIMNECPACIEFGEALATDPDGYHIVRHRDVLLVENGPWAGRYGIFRVNHDDTNRAILYQLRTDNPTHNPPTPYGASDPNGDSSYRPSDSGDRTDWQNDSTQYFCQVLRPYNNPIHSPELYLTDAARSSLVVAIAGVGFHDTVPTGHFHRDNFRAGYMVEVKNPGGNNHLDQFEVVRETDGTTPDEITAADLDNWDKDTVSPGLRLYGPAIPGVGVYAHDVFDPRLPYPKELEGQTLPSQAGIPDNFTVILPAIAAGADDAYAGMYFRALTGSGAWVPGGQEGYWYIKSYDGTSKEATLARNHRNVFDNTTVFEIVSFKPGDQSPPSNLLHTLFPGSLLEHSFLAAVKAGDDQGGGPPHCTATVVAGNPTVTAANIGNVRPAGKDFVTANTGADAPFDTGVVQVGDIVTFNAQNVADRRISAQYYVVTGNITASTFDVSPVPPDTSTAAMYFTVYRAAPTVYAWNGATHVVGNPVLITPIPEWSIW
ncbi:MAG: hypothetical protein KDB07_02705 [Planctomycetes bacterium]|nr:hypothetical protein [Planctomycetota bacterium]